MPVHRNQTNAVTSVPVTWKITYTYPCGVHSTTLATTKSQRNTSKAERHTPTIYKKTPPPPPHPFHKKEKKIPLHITFTLTILQKRNYNGLNTTRLSTNLFKSVPAGIINTGFNALTARNVSAAFPGPRGTPTIKFIGEFFWNLDITITLC